MSINMWYSKADVLRDLEEYNGQFSAPDLDDEYVVIGSRPPPLRVNDSEIDEEVRLRYGGSGDFCSNNNNHGPDLAGITDMLRMVNTIDPSQDVPTSPKLTKKSPTKRNMQKPVKESIIISKSKLNPDVPEFVPMRFKSDEKASSNSSPVSEVNDNKILGEPLPEPLPEFACGDAANERKSPKSICSDEEKQKIDALLKSKIISKQDTHEKKHERNAAIMALLRLHSRPSSSDTTPKCITSSANSSDKISLPQSEDSKQQTKPLILITPDYYAVPNCGPKTVNIDENEHSIPDIQLENEPKPLDEIKPPSPRQRMDPVLQESIDKVNKWLEDPEGKKKAKVSKPYFGPITYTQKSRSPTSKSSSSEARKESNPTPDTVSDTPSQEVAEPSNNVAKKNGKISQVLLNGTVKFQKKRPSGSNSPRSVASKKDSPVDGIPSYVPSKYAEELAQSFREQIKAREEKEKKYEQQLDVFSKLVKDLEARDLDIKQKALENNNQQSH